MSVLFLHMNSPNMHMAQVMTWGVTLAHSRHAGQPGAVLIWLFVENQLRIRGKSGAGRREICKKCGSVRRKIISKICLLGTHYAYRMSDVLRVLYSANGSTQESILAPLSGGRSSCLCFLLQAIEEMCSVKERLSLVR